MLNVPVGAGLCNLWPGFYSFFNFICSRIMKQHNVNLIYPVWIFFLPFFYCGLNMHYVYGFHFCL